MLVLEPVEPESALDELGVRSLDRGPPATLVQEGVGDEVHDMPAAQDLVPQHFEGVTTRRPVQSIEERDDASFGETIENGYHQTLSILGAVGEKCVEPDDGPVVRRPFARHFSRKEARMGGSSSEMHR